MSAKDDRETSIMEDMQEIQQKLMGNQRIDRELHPWAYLPETDETED